MRGNAFVAVIGMLFVIFLSGCNASLDRTLIFGTETKIAILDASADPAGRPSLTFGYKRREGVWMPLASGSLAGTGNFICKEKSDNSGLACLSVDAKKGGGNFQCAPSPDGVTANADTDQGKMFCIDLASKQEGHIFQASDGTVKSDAYAVLANFGLSSTLGAGQTNNNITQYFATGLAARALAEKGGAAVVNAASVTPDQAKANQAFVEQRSRDMQKIQTAVVDSAGNVDGANWKALLYKTCNGDNAFLLNFGGKPFPELEEELTTTSDAYRPTLAAATPLSDDDKNLTADANCND